MATPFGPVGTLGMIIVARDWRGRGLGRRMMERLMEGDGRQWWGPANSQDGLFQVMERFLRAFKKCRGDVEATLKELGVRRGLGEEPYFVKLGAAQRA